MNKLTLNTDKSKTITFKTKYNRNDVFKTNGKRTGNLNSLSYLSIMIDKKLCFREHSERVEEKLVQFCGIFYKLRKILSRSQLIKVFNTYVKPVVQNGILVYGTASEATMQKNDAIINRILRVIIFFKSLTQFLSSERNTKFFQPRSFICTNFSN